MGITLEYDLVARVKVESSDSDTDTITQLHKFIPLIGGSMSRRFTDSTYKLFYAPNVICKSHKRLIVDTSGVTDCIGASGDPSNPNEEADVAAHFLDGSGNIHQDDELMWAIVKHSGYTGPDKNTATDEYVQINHNGNSNSGPDPQHRIHSGMVYIFDGMNNSYAPHGGSYPFKVDQFTSKPTSALGEVMVSVLALIHDIDA